MSYELSDAIKVPILRRLLLAWDGQWFLKTVEAYGLEAAIAMNARVRTAFGRMEMRAMLKATGKSRADDLPDAVRLVAAYGDLLMGKALRAEFQEISSNRAEITISSCAAFEGAKLARLGRVDQACVACETLWQAWFEVLLPDDEITVEYPLRQGKGDPRCQFIVRTSPTSAVSIVK